VIERLPTLIAAVALALAAGFGAGYYAKGQATQAAVTKQTTTAVKQTGANIVQSAVRSQQVEASIQQTDSNIDQLKAAALARLQKEKTHAPTNPAGGNASHEYEAGRIATATQQPQPNDEGSGGRNPGSTLDFGTVRLLNRARDDAAVESTAGSAR
jgi:hypothetical protein